jgi:uracil-DNA glycosylase family 4
VSTQAVVVPRGPSPSPSASPAERVGNPQVSAEAPASADFLQRIAKSLEDGKSASRETASASTPMAPEAGPAAKAVETNVPAFKSLADHRAHMDRNLRTLHTGDPEGKDWKVVHGEGPEFAPLVLAALEPGAADGEAGRPFQGPGGILLEKMMRAIKRDMAALYRTTVVKVAAPRKVWTRRDLVRLHPLFLAELALCKAPVVLLLGEACAQAVLKTGKPLEELVQRFHRVDGAEGIDFAVTWHPDDLEGKEELKRKAWKDLQWLQPRLQGN